MSQPGNETRTDAESGQETEMFKIEKGVPVPVARGKRYPFTEMSVGDSFLVPASGDYKRLRGQVNSVVTNAAKRTGGKYSTRREGYGVRVWRVE